MTILKMNYKYPLFERIITNCLAEEIQEIKFVFLKTLPSTLERIFLDTARISCGAQLFSGGFLFRPQEFSAGCKYFLQLVARKNFCKSKRKTFTEQILSVENSFECAWENDYSRYLLHRYVTLKSICCDKT